MPSWIGSLPVKYSFWKSMTTNAVLAACKWSTGMAPDRARKVGCILLSPDAAAARLTLSRPRPAISILRCLPSWRVIGVVGWVEAISVLENMLANPVNEVGGHFRNTRHAWPVINPNRSCSRFAQTKIEQVPFTCRKRLKQLNATARLFTQSRGATSRENRPRLRTGWQRCGSGDAVGEGF